VHSTVTKFHLEDHAVSMLLQVEQDLEGFQPQPHRLTGVLQGMTLGVEGTVAEPINHPSALRVL
jgi:hypothetical protein